MTNSIRYLNRSAFGCLCCGSSELRREATVISPFLAKRCWNGKPELTWVMFCGQCDFRFYDRGLSDEEASRYYGSYRDETYLRERHRFEPFYTKREHEKLEMWLSCRDRRLALNQVLRKAGAPESFEAALDFGGGTGKMLLDIDAKRRAVFDVSVGQLEKGLAGITSHAELGGDWDLVLSCQVLEHLTDPFSSVVTIANTMPEGGWFYAEVPPQHWSNPARNGPARNAWLRWIVDKPRLLLAADIVSTAFRIKGGFLPPLGFIPMREHLNYFTVEALCALLTRAGFRIEWSGRNSLDCICAVGTRSASVRQQETTAA